MAVQDGNWEQDPGCSMYICIYLSLEKRNYFCCIVILSMYLLAVHKGFTNIKILNGAKFSAGQLPYMLEGGRFLLR